MWYSIQALRFCCLPNMGMNRHYSPILQLHLDLYPGEDLCGRDEVKVDRLG